jgi:hypothetical protein
MSTLHMDVQSLYKVGSSKLPHVADPFYVWPLQTSWSLLQLLTEHGQQRI